MKKLTVVGIGAGNYEGMTVAAVRAMETADVIVGYTAYCDLMRPYFPDKAFLATPMTRETERCRLALELAAEGKNAALICSGDAGVYGMACPALELAGEYGVEVDILAGVTAAASGAALLGAPLTNDFAVISLSDLLTPKEHLRKACDILLQYRSPETVCGIARNIGRAGEETKLTTLSQLRTYQADMFTAIFIGNTSTRVIDGRMVTPRGYDHEG